MMLEGCTIARVRQGGVSDYPGAGGSLYPLAHLRIFF